MNIQKMMKQAQMMQEKIAEAQAELAEKTVEVTTGGGKLTVVANGAGRRPVDQDQQGDRGP